MGEQVEFFEVPQACPVCGSLLARQTYFLFCVSLSCPVKLSGSVRTWVKRLGLLHWGDALIDELSDPQHQRIASIADLYRLSVADIAECCSGDKFARKCYDVLHSQKKVSLELLLSALNIQNMAVSTATDIVRAGFDTVAKVMTLVDAPESEALVALEAVPNVGAITARQVLDGLRDKRSVIEDLATVLEVGPSGGFLSGQTFCITGSTSKPRKALEKAIMDFGGGVKSSAGAGLTYLVTNDPDTGSKKMQGAKKHGTKVISESDLQAILASGTSLV